MEMNYKSNHSTLIALTARDYGPILNPFDSVRTDVSVAPSIDQRQIKMIRPAV